MSPQPRPSILSITPYKQGESDVGGINRVVKLSSNEGAFGPPPAAMKAHAEAAAELHRYPDGGCTELRRAIGRTWGLDPERIVCGVGSDELLALLCHAYGGEGTEIIMSQYGFSMYEISGTSAGSRVVKAPERNLSTDVDAMLAAVSPRTRMVMLANPNNPTGSLVPQGEMERLRAGLPSDVLLVIDAAYAEYVDDPGFDAGAKLVDANDNTVMTRTFSKIYGLGGIRLGWCYGPPAVVDVLNRVRSPFNVGLAVQAAGVGALSEPGWLEKGRAHNSAQREWLSGELRDAGFDAHPSHGNFFLVGFGSPGRAAAADAHLRSRGIIVRAMNSYGLSDALRVTVGTAEENGMVAEALRDFSHGA